MILMTEVQPYCIIWHVKLQMSCIASTGWALNTELELYMGWRSKLNADMNGTSENVLRGFWSSGKPNKKCRKVAARMHLEHCSVCQSTLNLIMSVFLKCSDTVSTGQNSNSLLTSSVLCPKYRGEVVFTLKV